MVIYKGLEITPEIRAYAMEAYQLGVQNGRNEILDQLAKLRDSISNLHSQIQVQDNGFR